MISDYEYERLSPVVRQEIDSLRRTVKALYGGGVTEVWGDPWGEPLASLQGATEAIPPSLKKVLKDAEAEGWAIGPTGVTMVARLNRKNTLPFYVRWDLKRDGDKLSWRFHGARAVNGQRLNFTDIGIYLKDPSVIYPEPPEGENCD